MSESILLYSFYRSAASYRVRIALNLKETKYEVKTINLVKNGGEQHGTEYAKLNPSCEVPTLVHGSLAIGQSMAIIDYLDRIFPERGVGRLFPTDPAKRALVVQACEILNSGCQPFHNLRVFQALEKQFAANQQQLDSWVAHWITYGLGAFQKLVENFAGPYCFGSLPTAADCFLVPQIASARRFAVDLSPFSRLLEVDKSLRDLSAVQKAAPELQSDFPAN